MNNFLSIRYFNDVKSFINILLFLIFIPFIAFSQLKDSTNTDNIQTPENFHSKNPFEKIQIKFDEFELYREFNNLKINVSIDGDPETVWLRTKLAVTNSANIENSDSPHYLSPFYLKYQRDSKFNPIKYVLGMAQVGAVGYLAYKHIKKYGFLK